MHTTRYDELINIPESQEKDEEPNSTSKTVDIVIDLCSDWKKKCSESIDFEVTKPYYWICKYRWKFLKLLRKKNSIQFKRVKDYRSQSRSSKYSAEEVICSIISILIVVILLIDAFLLVYTYFNERRPIYEPTRIYYNFYLIFKCIKIIFIYVGLIYNNRVFNKVYKVIWVNNKVAKKNNLKTAKGLYNRNLFLNFVHSYPMLEIICVIYLLLKYFHPNFHFYDESNIAAFIFMIPESELLFYCYQEIWIISYEIEKMCMFTFCVCESELSVKTECKPIDEEYKVKLLFDRSITAAKNVRERLEFLITFAIFVQSISLYFPITELKTSITKHSENLTTHHQIILSIWIIFNITILSYTFRRLTKIPKVYLESVQLFKIQSLHWKEEVQIKYLNCLKPYFEITPHLYFNQSTLAAVLILTQIFPYILRWFSFVDYGPN